MTAEYAPSEGARQVTAIAFPPRHCPSCGDPAGFVNGQGYCDRCGWQSGAGEAETLRAEARQVAEDASKATTAPAEFGPSTVATYDDACTCDDEYGDNPECRVCHADDEGDAKWSVIV